MKTLIVSVILLSSVVQAQRLIPASVRMRVTDDVGSPVRNVAVDGCFLDDSQSGASDSFEGMTDLKGEFLAKGRTMLGVYSKFVRADYYPTKNKSWIDGKQRVDGTIVERPKSWDIAVPVLLKRIKRQIPMFAKRFENPYIGQWENVGKYRLGCTSGYDIVKGSFLPPHGTGESADVEFRWKMIIYSFDDGKFAVDYDSLCDIHVANCVDGILRGVPDGSENGQTGSAFISDYEAPEAGYTNTISFYRNVRGSKVETNDDKHYLYYFRIRTQTNERGQVTNAYYGKIYGQLNGNFTYYLNPTPNDRNVEHDPKKNLFKGQ